ncbi:MAG TPA: hypothetical protein VMM78_00170 [Thermomicrobiales bacterium]|nr:hypothetical protein [Thermomicrobiales bacterium]
MLDPALTTTRRCPANLPEAPTRFNGRNRACNVDRGANLPRLRRHDMAVDYAGQRHAASFHLGRCLSGMSGLTDSALDLP